MGKKKKPVKTGTKQKKDTKFKPGQSGNLKGRPKGSKNFSTLFKEAIKKIAKENKITELQAEQDLIIKAYREAKKGNFSFYRDIMDRVYGKPQEKIDLTTAGKELPTPILDIKKNAKRNL